MAESQILQGLSSLKKKKKSSVLKGNRTRETAIKQEK